MPVIDAKQVLDLHLFCAVFENIPFQLVENKTSKNLYKNLWTYNKLDDLLSFELLEL